MGSRGTARRRRFRYAAIIRRAVSRTTTAATQRKKRPRPRVNPEDPLRPRHTSARAGKKMCTRISTPAHRPRGMVHPRILRIVVATTRSTKNSVDPPKSSNALLGTPVDGDPGARDALAFLISLVRDARDCRDASAKDVGGSGGTGHTAHERPAAGDSI